MQEKKHLQLNDLEAYQVAFGLSNYVWFRIEQWEYFTKKSVGVQFVAAVDSISANMAEAFGRHGKKTKLSSVATQEVWCMNAWTGMKKAESESYYRRKNRNIFFLFCRSCRNTLIP